MHHCLRFWFINTVVIVYRCLYNYDNWNCFFFVGFILDDNLDKHHAPWRIQSQKNIGSLSPEIYDSRLLDSIKPYQPRRLFLSACDFKFFEKHVQNLISYETSGSEIIYVLGVFSPKDEVKLVADRLYKFRLQNGLKKFIPFVYGNSSLEWVLRQQNSTEIQWDYMINYIRSSRYNLVKKVWNALGITINADSNFQDSSTFVIDFDNEVRQDLNNIIKKEYPSQSLIFSWDSSSSPSPNFTNTLSSCTFQTNSMAVNHPYKVVKAGFTAITPSAVGNVFLTLFEAYSIGDDRSFFFTRLFYFYYCDQVSILLAIRDIYTHEKYRQQVSWLDVYTSSIVNLSSSLARYMWCPKGKTI